MYKPQSPVNDVELDKVHETFLIAAMRVEVMWTRGANMSYLLKGTREDQMLGMTP